MDLTQAIDQGNMAHAKAQEREIFLLRDAIRSIIAAYDAPYYDDLDTFVDHLFDPIEQARKLLCPTTP